MQLTKLPSVFLSNARNLGNFKIVLQVSQISKSVITKMQLIVSKQEIVHTSKK